MGCLLSIRKHRLQPQSPVSSAPVLIQSISDGNHACANQVLESEEVHEASFLGSVVEESEQMVITTIRARNVASDPGRIPAGFYVVVHHSNLKWRTETKRPSTDDNVVEWTQVLIPIPSDLSATISLAIYASFEFLPVLGNGEQLKKLTTPVDQLLDHSTKDLPYNFFEGRDLTSPCPSVFISTKRRKQSYPSGLGVLEPYRSAAQSQCQLECATNEGHIALSRYRKNGETRELVYAIEQFELALDICPGGHPCRAAAQSNLAMAKFVRCELDDIDSSLDIPLTLYRDSLFLRPVGHPDCPSTLIQLAKVYLARFWKRRDEVDASEAEALLHEVINLGSAGTPEREAAMSVLALHKECKTERLQSGGKPSVEEPASRLTTEQAWGLSIQSLGRYESVGDIDDLERAISLLRASMSCMSASDHRYLARSTNLGIALRHRFSRLGDPSDLEEAILKQRRAVDLVSDDYPDKHMYLNMLGISLELRFQHFGHLKDLEEAISRQREASDLIRDDHPDRPTSLGHLITSLSTRFECLGETDNLEEAISWRRYVVDFTPVGHPDIPDYLNNLGWLLLARFDHLGEIRDLEEAVSRLQDVVAITPHDHPDKHTYYGCLGLSFLTRFHCLGELKDLEEAISWQRVAVDLAPDGHPHKLLSMGNLGSSLSARFEHLGELDNLEEAISRQQHAVNLIPDGHPEKPNHLYSLGISLKRRFVCLGDLKDVEEAILRLRDAAYYVPDGHPHKPRILSGLGAALRARFERLGEQSNLKEAILWQQDAVNLTPDGNPRKATYLNSLGNSLAVCFERFEELKDLEEAISRQQSAVTLTPDGSSEKASYLINLGSSFLLRFRRLGELGDLEEAISRQRDAIDLTPDGHLDRINRLNALGISLTSRFVRIGDLNDLEEAIFRQRNAVALASDGHPHKSKNLRHLGDSLVTRFERLGVLSDLQEAISFHRAAVDFTPDNHPDKPIYLSSLGISLSTRFKHLGESSDLEESILIQQRSLQLIPDGAEKIVHVVNLSVLLRVRSKQNGDPRDLDDAISMQQHAANLIPDRHPDTWMLLSNLGNSFSTRFDLFEGPSDLEDAISSYQGALDLIPEDHPGRAGLLIALGSSLKTRFEHTGELRNLEAAISRQQDGVILTPDGHPDKPFHQYHLGSTFFTRFKHLNKSSDIENAISLYSHAACASTGRISHRFLASRQWVSCARVLEHHSLLQAYSVSIALLPQLAWIGLSLPHRYRELAMGTDMVREAAAAAIELGYPETAVEWLEQGRSVVWEGLSQLRGSHNELFSAHPDLAYRLQELSAALEHASAARENLYLYPAQELNHRGSLQQEADRHRVLAIKRDELLQVIRALPGFEGFLLRKKFSQLRASAHSGPVVILNAAESRCDALIILADVDHVIHVPLLHFTFKRSRELQTSLNSYVRCAQGLVDMPYDDRDGQPAHENTGPWNSILSPLWKCVVKPVLGALALSTPGELSRIFWCPTGSFTFLPIHAAGFYDKYHSKPGHKVYDFVVSSYIPTLAILAPPLEPDTPVDRDLRLLAVHQPQTDGLRRLPGVDVELEHIRTVIDSSPSSRMSLTETSSGTVEEVLALMKEADWVHFSCHGIQDINNPTESGLCLADKRRLKLSDAISLSRPRGGLAFLSACQTAMGDTDLPDEAIHITAGMLFAGYGGVVGTMWSINDKLAPNVAKDVYEQLFRSGTTPDYQEAARALQNAVGRLRDGEVSFKDWLPFIHVGL